MKTKTIKNAILTFASALLILTLISGCVKIQGPDSGSKDNSDGYADGDYPLKTDVSLNYWVGLNPNIAAVCSSMNETEFAKTVIEKTGIKVNYTHPPVGQEREQFSTMVASNDMPDIVEYGWFGYPGGPQKAISDGAIMNLKDSLEKYAPNYTKLLKETPEIDKAMKTDTGDYFMFPFVRGDDILMTFYGGMIRQDLLEKAKLPVPETIDEWYTTLKAFKEMGLEYPLSLRIDPTILNTAPAFCGAYNVGGRFYLDGSTVKFGPVEAGFREYLTTMAKWYKEGLLDKDFPSITTDTKRLSSIFINGECGATFGYCGSDFGRYITGGVAANPEFELVPFRYPVLKKGDKPEFAQRDIMVPGAGAAVSAKSKNQEMAMRFLDYAYSEAGHMVFNYGVEGVSYNMVDGVPTYSELVTDPEKNGGLAVAQGIARYALGSLQGPYVQDKHYVTQSYSNQVQKDALTLWMDNNMKNHTLPLLTYTPEENATVSKKMADIDTYVQEELVKFITGVNSLNNYDKYLADLKSMDVEEIIKITQDSYDRYQKK